MNRFEAMPALMRTAFGGGPCLLLLLVLALHAPKSCAEDLPAPVPSAEPIVADRPVPAFAQDLVLGSYYGAKDNPTIVLVNTRTHERMPLKKGVPTANGMTLKSL